MASPLLCLSTLLLWTVVSISGMRMTLEVLENWGIKTLVGLSLSDGTELRLLPECREDHLSCQTWLNEWSETCIWGNWCCHHCYRCQVFRHTTWEQKVWELVVDQPRWQNRETTWENVRNCVDTSASSLCWFHCWIPEQVELSCPYRGHFRWSCALPRGNHRESSYPCTVGASV